MANVESLFGGPTGEKKASQALVEGLAELLEMARSGEVNAMAAAYTRADGTACYLISGYVGSYSMLGALETAKAELLEAAKA